MLKGVIPIEQIKQWPSDSQAVAKQLPSSGRAIVIGSQAIAKQSLSNYMK